MAHNSEALKSRRIGRAALSLSEIAFGCGGNAGLMVSDDLAVQREVIAHALGRGITYFDCSPDYGNGRAEENLGKILTDLGASATTTINTKVEIRAENLHDIAGHVVTSVEQSLTRLKRDRVEIVQIHNGPVTRRPRLEGSDYKTLWIEDYRRADGAMEGLFRLVRDGKAQRAGFVCRGEDRQEVLYLLETGLFSLINIPYTLLNPSGTQEARDFVGPDYGGVIDEAARRDIGVAVFSPLAGGLLTTALLSGRQTHPRARRKDLAALASNPALRLGNEFDNFARKHGLTITELAYRFVLSHPGVTCLIGGFSSIQHVDDAVSAARNGPLADPVLAEIRDLRKNFLKSR